MGYFVGLFLLIVVSSAVVTSRWPEWGGVMQAVSAVALLALMALLSLVTTHLARRHQAEQQALEAAGELVQLRRWPEAAALLQQILSRPAPGVAYRVQALIFLAAVLSRYHRFDDAVAVHNHLLEHEPALDDATAHGVRLGRAMAMLREDHLFDADRAISELRRTAPGDVRGADSAAQTLVEIYRDVKTGHAAEAAALFEDRLPLLRDGLGHRVADAYALAARAYDLTGRDAEAALAYERATLLAPLVELQRRYPEVQPLAQKYRPAAAPPEAA